MINDNARSENVSKIKSYFEAKKSVRTSGGVE